MIITLAETRPGLTAPCGCHQVTYRDRVIGYSYCTAHGGNPCACYSAPRGADDAVLLGPVVCAQHAPATRP